MVTVSAPELLSGHARKRATNSAAARANHLLATPPAKVNEFPKRFFFRQVGGIPQSKVAQFCRQQKVLPTRFLIHELIPITISGHRTYAMSRLGRGRNRGKRSPYRPKMAVDIVFKSGIITASSRRPSSCAQNPSPAPALTGSGLCAFCPCRRASRWA